MNPFAFFTSTTVPLVVKLCAPFAFAFVVVLTSTFIYVMATNKAQRESFFILTLLGGFVFAFLRTLTWLLEGV